MVENFDRIVLAVPDLSAACAQYRDILGGETYFTHAENQGRCAWWGLSNTVIELAERAVDSGHIEGVVFSAPGEQQQKRGVANTLGVDIGLCDGSATSAFRQRQPEAQCGDLCVDHVVLRTADAQACVDLFTGELGIRLALDKTVPQWGGRMLFFRAGKLTLEVIESGGDEKAAPAFWGLAYQCEDLAGFARTLAARGVAISDIRDGRKSGTRVATLKSHDLGIPTLLIQPAK